jgi:hypothetical protein
MAALPVFIDPESLPDLQHRSETLFYPPGSIAPILDWPHYGDPGLAPLRRSSGGSITAILKWHYSSDH